MDVMGLKRRAEGHTLVCPYLLYVDAQYRARANNEILTNAPLHMVSIGPGEFAVNLKGPD